MTKTIDDRKSSKGRKGTDQWSYPDMVGVHFPFDDYEKSTLGLIDTLSDNPYTFFSFKLKRHVTASTLRENYFQAVSNSSWANEGYLVAAKFDLEDFRDDLSRLVNAFGIGVIELNIEDVAQSSVLFPAKHRDTLDWATVDRLVEKNSDFKDFVDEVVEDATVKCIRGQYEYEKIIDFEEYDKYLRDNGFV